MSITFGPPKRNWKRHFAANESGAKESSDECDAPKPSTRVTIPIQESIRPRNQHPLRGTDREYTTKESGNSSVINSGNSECVRSGTPGPDISIRPRNRHTPRDTGRDNIASEQGDSSAINSGSSEIREAASWTSSLRPRSWTLSLKQEALIAAILVMVFILRSLSHSSAERPSWLRPGLQPAMLPPKNILHFRNEIVARYNTCALDLAHSHTQFPVRNISQSLRRLDLENTRKNQDVETLGSLLAILLYTSKTAKRDENCSHLSQLQLDVTEAWNASCKIQELIKADLELSGDTCSLVLRSLSSAHQILAKLDKEADGRFQIGVDYAERDRMYSENEMWLDIFQSFGQELKVRESLLGWEFKRQRGIEGGLREVEKRIEGFRLGHRAESQDAVGSACTRFQIEQVERGLLDTTMNAAGDEAARQNVREYYDSL